LHAHEFIGDERGGLRGVINRHREKKRHPCGHVMRALDGDFPFAAEVALAPRLGARGDDRHKQGAGADLGADLRVPRIAAAQLILVKPHLHAEGAQGVSQAAGDFGIFAGVTEKNRARRSCGIRHKSR